MIKKRTEKGNIDGRCHRALSSDKSAEEKLTDSDVPTNRSRKCKAQSVTNIKTAKTLKGKNNQTSKQIDNSSCDPTDEKFNNAKEDEEIFESNDQKSNILTKNNTNDSLPAGKENHSNGNKYCELLNLFNGKEEDFNNFMKHYNIWQQSLANSGNKQQSKKKETKLQKLKKPMKAKVCSSTPSIKLISPKSKKTKKETNKKSNVPNEDGFKKADIPVPVEIDIKHSKSLNDNLTDKTAERDSHPSAVGKLDVISETEIETSEEETVENESEINHDNINPAKVDQRCSIDSFDNSKKLGDTENGNLYISGNSVDFQSVAENPEKKLITEVKNNSDQIEDNNLKTVLPSEYSLNSQPITKNLEKMVTEVNSYSNYNEENNLKNDVKFHNEGNCDSLGSNGFVTLTSLEESVVNDCPDKDDICHQSLDYMELEVKKCFASEPVTLINGESGVASNLEVNIDNELSQLTENDNIKGISIVTNAIIQRELETENVSKRKRSISDEQDTHIKKSKNSNMLPDSKSSEIKKNLTHSEPCSKWSAEESNPHYEELIYSDEEKTNYSVLGDVSDSVSSLPDRKLINNKECNIMSKSDESLLDLHESKSISCLDSDFTDSIDVLKTNNGNCFEDVTENSEKFVNFEHEDTPKKSLYNGCNDKKKGAVENKKSELKKYMQIIKRKEKGSISSSKCKKLMKTKTQKHKAKKFLTICKNDNKENSSGKEVVKEKMPDTINSKHQSLPNKVKEQRNENKGILETDLPVVEVTYKGESLHGILGCANSLDFFTMYNLNQKKEEKENLLNISHTKEVLKQFLRPLCCDMLRKGGCNIPWSCKKEHMVHKDFFNGMSKHNAWLIIAFVLRISDNISINFIEAILEFLSSHKAKKKILLVSRHILESRQKDVSYLKLCWEQIFKALECCDLERWEAIRTVVEFIMNTISSLKAETIHQLLMIWNVHSSTLANTWLIVEPIVTVKKTILPPSILPKIIGELIAVEPQDKKNIYRLVVQQLTTLSIEDLNLISYRLLNDFLRKVAQEGLHAEEKLLRDRMNTAYYSPFCQQQSSLHAKSAMSASNHSSLRRSKSMASLAIISSDSNFQAHIKVHEDEKMEAAIVRALQCSNYDSVIKVLISCYKKNFVNKILLSIYKYVMDEHTYSILKNILGKIKEYSMPHIEEVNDLVGNIVVTVMLDYVKQYNWKEANNFFVLLEEYSPNKYKVKSLTDGTLRPVRLAVTYSEINYYNGRYKESIGIFISTKLINPDSSEWLVPGGTKEDFSVINVMVSFLMNELMNKNIINIATMLFKAVLEVQTSIITPIDISVYFETLLYRLFELTNEYPETAVKLFIRVNNKDRNISLYGLTYRALIVLAYRTHRHSIIRDLFYKAIEEYSYPIIEENENTIMLLRSHTEEEIIVYITEWVAIFKEKLSKANNSTSDHQIYIKFKDAVLEDFLDDQVLGIPATFKEVDQTLPGAVKRLDHVMKRLNIKSKQIKKDTLSIESQSFQNFLNKIKI